MERVGDRGRQGASRLWADLGAGSWTDGRVKTLKEHNLLRLLSKTSASTMLLQYDVAGVGKLTYQVRSWIGRSFSGGGV